VQCSQSGTAFGSRTDNTVCDLEWVYTETDKQYVKAYFCKTHQQWAYEFPVSVQITWPDGTTSQAKEWR